MNNKMKKKMLELKERERELCFVARMLLSQSESKNEMNDIKIKDEVLLGFITAL